MVGRILQLAIPLVAGTLARVLTTIQTVAERLTLSLCQILFDVRVKHFVRLDVLNKA